MAAELGAEFDFSAALKYGLVPLITDSPDANARLNAYLTLYLEVKRATKINNKDLHSLKRFKEDYPEATVLTYEGTFQLHSFSNGLILNARNTPDIFLSLAFLLVVKIC